MEMESSLSTPERYKGNIIREFHPIVARFGFTEPQWDYDPELDVVRVQFDNPERADALQVDCHVQDDSYSPNFCRMDGDWRTCIEGKSRSLSAFRATLSRWITDFCEECRTGSEEETLAEL